MPELKKPVSLHGTRFKLAEQDRNVWSVELENETLLTAAADPAFWAHVAQKLRRGDRIEIYPENLTWFAELLVTDCGATWAKTQPLRMIELEAAIIPEILLENGRYKIDFAGKSEMYRITDNASKNVLKSKCKTSLEAQNWLNDYQRSIAPAKQAI